ncbi:MAG: EF-hand domain-containing protein [Pseudomonadota bacterium]
MRGSKIEVLLGVSAIVLGLTLPVLARAAEPDGIEARGKAMSLADTNKDGKVSATEWKAVTDLRFKKSDTNSDGQISKTEYEAASEKLYTRMLNRKADGAPPAEGE